MEAAEAARTGGPRLKHGQSQRQGATVSMQFKASPCRDANHYRVDDMIRLAPTVGRQPSNNHVEVEASVKHASPRNIKYPRLAHLGTHHILREWAARVIQTRYNQYHRVRLRAIRQAEATKAKHHAIAYDIMECLVVELIRIEFIPDILIDIFTTGMDEYAAHPVEIQAMNQCYNAICREVVQGEVRDIVAATVDRLVASYFTATNEATLATALPPWQRLVDSFLADWIHPLLHEIVLEGVDDLVTQYMAAKQQSALFDTWMQYILVETATSSFHEMQRECALDTILSEEMHGILHDIATSEAESARTANAQVIREKERALIADTASSHLVDHAMLRALLELLALKADRLAFKDSCDQFMSMLMLKRLLALQHQQTEQEMAVRSSAVLAACHNQCMQASLGQLVSRLLVDGLDEWEDRIHLEERNAQASTLTKKPS